MLFNFLDYFQSVIVFYYLQQLYCYVYFFKFLCVDGLLRQLIKSLFAQMHLAISTDSDSNSVPAHLRPENSKDIVI